MGLFPLGADLLSPSSSPSPLPRDPDYRPRSLHPDVRVNVPRRLRNVPRALANVPRRLGKVPRGLGNVPRACGETPRRRGVVPRVPAKSPGRRGIIPNACGTVPRRRETVSRARDPARRPFGPTENQGPPAADGEASFSPPEDTGASPAFCQPTPSSSLLLTLHDPLPSLPSVRRRLSRDPAGTRPKKTIGSRTVIRPGTN